MKVKVISRNPDEYLRETKKDIHKVPRNYDPSLHHFQAAREYVRALNAVKLERVFAKPFVGSLDGHRDAISALAKHPRHLSEAISAAHDGEVRVWDLARRECSRSFVAHEGAVRDVTYSRSGNSILTIGDDKTIKFWRSDTDEDLPTNTIVSKYVLGGVGRSYREDKFATCGEVCQLWEESRNEPVKTFRWGVDSLSHVAFSPVETNVLAACASDRSVILYDTRERGALRKVVLKMRTNRVAWNPMEAYVFTCANEDYNLYTFDTRKLRHPVNVHRDHVSAVIDVDYSPTGKEFVSGSYDKTVRIFEADKGHSRDVYHTKRMQRLTAVRWTLDNKFVLSGSDEMNVRIWKAKASEKLGPLKPRERRALNYAETLKEKFASHPEIKRIKRHRHVPKHIYNAQNELRTAREKAKRKEGNRRVHSKKGEVPHVPERKKHVVSEIE